MQHKHLFIFCLTLLVISSGCKVSKSTDQGIQGKVTWLEGNQMPKITEEKNEVNPKGDPVQRKVVFYPLTSLEDAKLEDGLFRSVEGEPILEVETNEKGNYTAVLPPGNYSVFTQEEGGLFANRFDGEGNIQPVHVKQGEWSNLDITINYKAYF